MKSLYLSLLLFPACYAAPSQEAAPSLEWLTEEALQFEEGTDYQAVTELRFSSTPTDEHLRSLQQLPRLTSLQIWDEGCFQAPGYPIGLMNDDTLALIAELHQLESLAIAGWNVFYSNAGLQHIVQMPKLAKLKVSMAPNVTDESMRILAQMPTLTHLDITYTEITEAGLSYLLEAAKLENVAYGWTRTQEMHAQRFLKAHPQTTFLAGFEAP
ncbi:MAG: hypothetical protein O3A95_08820 [Planctomycetota bacterium]|nr:hypothetical protein [Planctomycetota bacterium]MDA1114383.1 hypothetical protein [Planctomycetota bacterium]